MKASRAASYAGPVASIANGSPVSPGVTVTWAPHGDVAIEVLAQRAPCACSASSPGATRRLTFARAAGTRVLLASATRRGVDSEHGDRRLRPEPVDDDAAADQLDAVDHARLRPQPVLGVVDVGRRPVDAGPSTATLPASSCRVASSRAQRRERVRHDAAPHARSGPRAPGCAPRRRSRRARAAMWSARARRCPSCRSRRSR